MLDDSQKRFFLKRNCLVRLCHFKLQVNKFKFKFICFRLGRPCSNDCAIAEETLEDLSE